MQIKGDWGMDFLFCLSCSIAAIINQRKIIRKQPLVLLVYLLSIIYLVLTLFRMNSLRWFQVSIPAVACMFIDLLSLVIVALTVICLRRKKQ